LQAAHVLVVKSLMAGTSVIHLRRQKALKLFGE
jgi:hypothetical protein